jgi:hypothetical protein
MSTFHVTIDGKPWCIAKCEITRAVELAGCLGVCAHASEESAKEHVEFVKKLFPDVDTQVVAGSCPAYDRSFQDQWED